MLSVEPKASLRTLTETLIIRDVTKTEFNNCFIIHSFAFSLTLSTNNELSHKTTYGSHKKQWKRFKISQ